MNNHHDACVVRQFVSVRRHNSHVEELLHLREHLLLALARLRISGEAQPVEHGDDGFAAATEFGDEARQVIFQKRFTLGRE